MKKIFIGKRWLAFAVAMALVVSALAVGLSMTFASNPYQVRLVQPNNYAGIVDVGHTTPISGFGVRSVMSSDNQRLTVVRSGSGAAVTGVSPGVGAVSMASTIMPLNVPIQVINSALISGYDLASNGEINRNVGDTPFSINNYVTTYTTVRTINNLDGTVGHSGYVQNNAPRNDIRWTSRNTDVAAIDSATGQVTVHGRGVAVMIGSFTDRWGVPRTITMLVGVEVNVGRSLLSDLQNEIRRGETILTLPDQPYEAEGIGVLQDAVIAGTNTMSASPAPTDQQIRDAIKAIEDAIGELTFATGAIVEVGDRRFIRATNDLYFELDSNGNVRVPLRQYRRLANGDMEFVRTGCADCEALAVIIAMLEELLGEQIDPNDLVALQTLINNLIDEIGRLQLENETLREFIEYLMELLGIDDFDWEQLLLEVERLKTALEEALAKACENEFCGVAHIRHVAATNTYYVRTAATHRIGSTYYHIYLQLEATPVDGPRNVRHPFVYAIFNPGRTVVYPAEGGGWTTDPPATVTGLAVTGTPTKTNYTPGESFDTTGLTIELTMSSGPNQPITSGFTVTPNPLTAGTTSVTITHTASGFSQTVGGLTVQAGKTIMPEDGLEIHASSTHRTVFNTGERFTAVGLVLHAFYTDGTDEVITSGFTTSPMHNTLFNNAGPRTVTVTFNGESITYTVQVRTPVILPPIQNAHGGIDGIVIGPEITGDTDSNWLAIATQNVDGQDYLLIVRARSIGNTTTSYNYVGGAAKTTITNWIDNPAQAQLKSLAVQTDADSRMPAGFNANNPDGFSSPTPNSTGGVYAFLLSFQEAVNFCSASHGSISSPVGSPTPAPGNRAKITAAGAAQGDADSSSWWLRSPGNLSSLAACVFTTGQVHHDGPTLSFALRPALWVPSYILGQ